MCVATYSDAAIAPKFDAADNASYRGAAVEPVRKADLLDNNFIWIEPNVSVVKTQDQRHHG